MTNFQKKTVNFSMLLDNYDIQSIRGLLQLQKSLEAFRSAGNTPDDLPALISKKEQEVKQMLGYRTLEVIKIELAEDLK